MKDYFALTHKYIMPNGASRTRSLCNDVLYYWAAGADLRKDKA